MECNAVKVGDYLIYGNLGGTIRDISMELGGRCGEEWYPEKRSVRRDWIKTFW